MKRAVIAYLARGESEEAIEYALREMAELARNVDLEAVGWVIQRKASPDPSYLLGEGKIQELQKKVEELEAEAVIFNLELSPRQAVKLEERLGQAEIWDRTQVILEIFNRRAHSREGKIQVELARLSYLYPRMLGWGQILSRLGGGLGTRGPGETKLEVLRRTVRQRIHRLRKELEEVRRNRQLLRKRRAQSAVPVVALVGYTNAGKSTLLNALSSSAHKVLAEDRLFATLDPVSRRVELPSGRHIILTDTVGFIHDMPPKLKEAFKATLEELESAHLLLHVIDLTSPYMELQIEAVEKILGELGLGERPCIRVYNKLDRFSGTPPWDGIAISALHGINLPLLLRRIEEELFSQMEITLHIPYTSLGAVSRLRSRIEIVAERYTETGVEMVLRGRREDLKLLEKSFRKEL